jgi:hypothetical protein
MEQATLGYQSSLALGQLVCRELDLMLFSFASLILASVSPRNLLGL